LRVGGEKLYRKARNDMGTDTVKVT